VTLALSNVADHIADYITALATVYSLAIIAYILTSLAFSLGLRIPYSSWSDAILAFLRDVSEPFLRIFRRVLPSLGGLDLSPIIAILVIQIVARLIASAIRP
jgi:YggT family protein